MKILILSIDLTFFNEKLLAPIVVAGTLLFFNRYIEWKRRYMERKELKEYFHTWADLISESIPQQIEEYKILANKFNEDYKFDFTLPRQSLYMNWFLEINNERMVDMFKWISNINSDDLRGIYFNIHSSVINLNSMEKHEYPFHTGMVERYTKVLELQRLNNNNLLSFYNKSIIPELSKNLNSKFLMDLYNINNEFNSNKAVSFLDYKVKLIDRIKECADKHCKDPSNIPLASELGVNIVPFNSIFYEVEQIREGITFQYNSLATDVKHHLDVIVGSSNYLRGSRIKKWYYYDIPLIIKSLKSVNSLIHIWVLNLFLLLINIFLR